MSKWHRPDGDSSSDDRDLHQDMRTDVSHDDADALDSWLDEIARNDGSPSTRSGSGHDRPDARTGNHNGSVDAGSLAATAAAFQRRIETAQSRNTRAAHPDPELWEKIMEKTASSAAAGATPVAVSRAPATTAPNPALRRGSQPSRSSRSHAIQRQRAWNVFANIGLVIAILVAGFGVWRYYGEPGLPGASDNPPTMPGVAMQPSTPDSTPEPAEEPVITMPPVATPQPTTDCDFSGGIPIFPGVDSAPVDGTALFLTPDGDLVLTCPEEPADTTLATGVASAGPREWPGIVGIYYQAEQPQDRQPAIVNVFTGEVVRIGLDPVVERLYLEQAIDSPWMLAPDFEDLTEWKITDLRTMESRRLSNIPGGNIPEGAGILTAANGAGGTFVIAAQELSSGDGKITSGKLLVIDGALDRARWISLPADMPPVTGIEVAPDGRHLALKSNNLSQDPSGVLLPGDMNAYSIVSTIDGNEVARSETFEDYETTMQWVQGGEALVYTNNTSLMQISVEPGTVPTALIEGNHRLNLQGLTVDPDVVLVSRQPTEEYATVVPMGEEVHLYSVNTRTGEMLTIQGRDISHNVGWWEPPTRFLVMYEPQIAPDGPMTYPVVNAVTGDQLGEIDDVPLRDIGVPGIFYPDLGLHSVVGSMDGNTEVIGFDSQHIYLMNMVDGTPEVRQITSPPGLLSDVSVTVSMFLSPDGSMLSLTGQGDESQTRWLLPLDGEPDEWIEVPTTVPSEGPAYIFFVPGTGD